MSDYDFSGLTYRQREILSFQGWSVSRAGFLPQPRPSTMRKLIDRGLAIEHETKFHGLKVLEYEVPIPVHMAWCKICADSVDSGKV